MKTIFLSTLLSFFFVDSPITSIDFWQYSEDPLVLKYATSNEKTLNSESLLYLTNNNKSEFDKLALINALGWDYNLTKNNSAVFLEHIGGLNKATDFEKTMYSYFLALKDYKNVREPYKILNQIEHNSQSVFLIKTIIYSQKYFLDFNPDSIWNLFKEIDGLTEFDSSQLEKAFESCKKYLIFYKQN
tara:strand:- start:203 stop:763 length:561 start_codon:yes stop_codon:yes gene_type:complete